MDDDSFEGFISAVCKGCGDCCENWPAYYLNSKGNVTCLRWFKEDGSYQAIAPGFLKEKVCYYFDKEKRMCRIYDRRRPEPCEQYLCFQFSIPRMLTVRPSTPNG
ncbi:MAG: YkgJ family cysteine cluster protein [Candidatus Thermoplasmatota archaeon]|nr:YkgJ family cysteine cluster protein [Candidatus Thermoplasmatota archaeon]